MSQMKLIINANIPIKSIRIGINIDIGCPSEIPIGYTNW